MKKWFLIIALLFQVTTWASGPNDGIYEVSFDGTFVFFASIHQNGDQLILLSLDDSSLHWEGLSGTQFGEEYEMSVIVGTSEAIGLLNFTDDTNAVMLIFNCLPVLGVDPGAVCSIPEGASLDLAKIF